jgi:hypothetical protein
MVRPWMPLAGMFAGSPHWGSLEKRKPLQPSDNPFGTRLSPTSPVTFHYRCLRAVPMMGGGDDINLTIVLYIFIFLKNLCETYPALYPACFANKKPVMTGGRFAMVPYVRRMRTAPGQQVNATKR